MNPECWLVTALREELPFSHDYLVELAERLLAKMPREQVALAIAGSVRAVLEQKGLCSAVGAERVSRECGNNAAGTVVLALGEAR